MFQYSNVLLLIIQLVFLTDGVTCLHSLFTQFVLLLSLFIVGWPDLLVFWVSEKYVYYFSGISHEIFS